MNIPLIFIALIVCLLTIYMMNRFVKRPNIYCFILLIQFLSYCSIIYSFENVFTIPQIELLIILCSIFIPSCIVLFDYYKMKRTVKNNRINIHLVEKKKKQEVEKLNFHTSWKMLNIIKRNFSSYCFESLDISDKNFQ